MNYFAHGLPFLHRPRALAPYELTGAIVPDLVRVLERRRRVDLERIRVAGNGAPDNGHEEYAPRLALVRGILRHHADDLEFHASRRFQELSARVTALLRRDLDGGPRFRPSVIAHILVEMLLDAALIERDRRHLDRYYETLGRVDPVRLCRELEEVLGFLPERFAELWSAFLEDRFLADYSHDPGVAYRLDRVSRRARMPALPAGFAALLPAVRAWVREQDEALLPAATRGCVAPANGSARRALHPGQK
jgi:hypothetical protein